MSIIPFVVVDIPPTEIEPDAVKFVVDAPPLSVERSETLKAPGVDRLAGLNVFVERFVTNIFVAVALVNVEFIATNFCSVVVPVTSRVPPIVALLTILSPTPDPAAVMRPPDVNAPVVVALPKTDRLFETVRFVVVAPPLRVVSPVIFALPVNNEFPVTSKIFPVDDVAEAPTKTT